MAFAALTNIFSTGSLLAAPVTALSLIPLLALGINYYRYQSIDPEGRPIDAQKVRRRIFLCFFFFYCIFISIKLLAI